MRRRLFSLVVAGDPGQARTTIRSSVEDVLKSCVSLVKNPTTFKHFLPESFEVLGGSELLTASSRIPSLDGICERDRILRSLDGLPQLQRVGNVTSHRFEEIINGRLYEIEVSAVQSDRWRAYLVSLNGGTTALMPFYGSTPLEAAELLIGWLTRAHRVTSNSV